jgi:hypothetical protein
MLAWAAGHPHLSYWVSTAISAGRLKHMAGQPLRKHRGKSRSAIPPQALPAPLTKLTWMRRILSLFANLEGIRKNLKNNPTQSRFFAQISDDDQSFER